MAKGYVKEKKKPTEAELLSDLPRAKPEMDRVKHSRNWRAGDGVTVKLSPSLPSSILRMYKARTLTAAQCRAAEIFIADHDQGYGSGIATTQFKERVQGGGIAGDHVSASVIDARARHNSARDVMAAKSIMDVVVGVLINGVVLTAAGDYSKRYSRAESRRTCASTLLGVGLLILSEHYGLTNTHKDD